MRERSAAQQHFLDLCELVEHPKPADVDPIGESFTFERGAEKHGGGDGWADVWKRGHFGWEYKGKHKDLDEAYNQLLQYRESLENPPLLVVCDMDRIIVRTNFTNTATQKHEIRLVELGSPQNLNILRAVFHSPDSLKPGPSRQIITQKAAEEVAKIAQGLRERGHDPHRVARFLDRIIFCLFAEDVSLLPERMFARIVDAGRKNPGVFCELLGKLFHAMAHGGYFGAEVVRYFNGGLFGDADVLEMAIEDIEHIRNAAKLDWGAVDPSIFGTLFERGLDPAKRSQLGAHYTSREDIETLVEPVVMQPLRREWAEARREAESVLGNGKKKAREHVDKLLHDFLARLGNVKVLDPACGSGNFLYVTLQELKDLEKEVIEFAFERDFSGFLPSVGPWQLYGIEINSYAHELAQMTVWIGYLQWMRDHGHPAWEEPILRDTDNFLCMDAILDLSDPDNPKEPEWPEVDFIVGNPPFLGGKKMRCELGDAYVDNMFAYWRGRVRPEADLCCYWFEKARAQIDAGKCQTAGLLATQGIRGGASRETLKRIKETGDIFFAESDRPWILDGASVHVSLIGFDSGKEDSRQLDGVNVLTINPALTATTDVSIANRLESQADIAFMGMTPSGPFTVSSVTSCAMLREPNVNGRPNSDVMYPWVSGADITGVSSDNWVIDLNSCVSEPLAAVYDAPFTWIQQEVSRARQGYRTGGKYFWKFERSRPEMRQALCGLQRFLCTPRLAKYRFFVWLSAPTLPDCQLIVFAEHSDYFLGVLHCRVHELWARAQGTQLRERESGFRYTPTTCFETFPFPEPTAEQESAIAEAARELDTLRNAWLNPPEWTREEIMEFPGSIDGPWARYVHKPDERGIGTVRYPRIVARNAECEAQLAKRTLTNLYNQRPAWLELVHKKLDEAVFAAYGWNPELTDDQVVEKLLELNLARAGKER